MIFLNPANNVQRCVLGGAHAIWCFLFGWLYYACKGMWGTAIISFFTFNGLFIVLPIMNRSLVRKHYQDRGWIEQ